MREIFKSADCVMFDFDSTLSSDEGIDQFARFLGKHEQVLEFTKQAMEGKLLFNESLINRMKILNPTKLELASFIDNYEPPISLYAQQLIEILQKRNVDIYIVSGGLRSIINKAARPLNIEPNKIYANDILFDTNGNYSHIDDINLTFYNDGKSKVANCLRKKYCYNVIVHVGDGANDLQVKDCVNLMIGYGGNVVRPVVKEHAHWFVESFQELIDVLK